MLLKKRGYFFILDAVIGLFILIIGVLLITSYHVSVPSQTQVNFLSDDLIRLFSNKKIKDINNPYVGIGGELWKNGNITDPDNSLLQQMGEFYATNKLELANKSIRNITFGVVPPQFRFEFWMDGVILYPLSLTPEHIRSKANTNLMLTSKKITFGIFNRTTAKIWGPYKAEVYLWEDTKRTSNTRLTQLNICQNAQGLGQCDGLDALYGVGYQFACCNEHVFCC